MVQAAYSSDDLLAPGSGSRRERLTIGLLALSHSVDDFYQGAIPALLPFLVAEREYTYAAATGLTLAATFFSSLAQPAFGILTDRLRLWWLAALGLTVAGIGVGLAGVGESYAFTWLAIALSGLGVAAYHPEAARAARMAAGASAKQMSWFALGGNLGFAAAPPLVTPLILAAGLSGTPFLMIPALIMGLVLLILQPRLQRAAAAGSGRRRAATTGRDDWRAFSWLTGLVMSRSIVFFGLSSLLALYIMEQFGTEPAIGSAVLTTFWAAGLGGTLTGGWLADRYGRLLPIRLGYLLTLPALAGLVLAPTLPIAFVAAALAGIALYLPFSVQVTLGQEYLPTRLGTASGVTLGLAVSAGGAAAPILGYLADTQGLRVALAVLLILPVIALIGTTRLYDPKRLSVAAGS